MYQVGISKGITCISVQVSLKSFLKNDTIMNRSIFGEKPKYLPEVVNRHNLRIAGSELSPPPPPLLPSYLNVKCSEVYICVALSEEKVTVLFLCRTNSDRDCLSWYAAVCVVMPQCQEGILVTFTITLGPHDAFIMK